jgi:undecaprenyl-diphosphatase
VDWIYSVLLGIVEGITEFLPVSSTAHLLLMQRFVALDLEQPFWIVFTIFIQIGAILAVVVYFRHRIVELLRDFARGRPGEDRSNAPALSAGSSAAESGPLHYATGEVPSPPRRGLHPVWLIAIASAPVFLIGMVVYKWVEAYMASPLIIAGALFGGGIVMIAIEWYRPQVRTEQMEGVTLGQALVIGFAQLLSAVLPGTSRAAATIMAGMACGMSRRAATEFSFFLAIPVMFAAGGYSLLRNRTTVTGEELAIIAVGTAVSFIVAWLVIAGLMEYIKRYTFVPFGLYRIALAAAVYVAVTWA